MGGGEEYSFMIGELKATVKALGESLNKYTSTVEKDRAEISKRFLDGEKIMDGLAADQRSLRKSQKLTFRILAAMGIVVILIGLIAAPVMLESEVFRDGLVKGLLQAAVRLF